MLVRTVGIYAIQHKESVTGVALMDIAVKRAQQEMNVMVPLAETMVMNVCRDHWNMLVRAVGINAIEHKDSVAIVAQTACVVETNGQEMNVMDRLVELVDMNVFQNQVILNDPHSHSCEFKDNF